LVRELSIGLGKLTFDDNFEGFEWTGDIEAGEEVQIINFGYNSSGIRFIPAQMIVISIEGPPTIVKGSTEWTNEYLYVKNIASESTATATIRFLK
jgi:hypothetical protein